MARRFGSVRRLASGRYQALHESTSTANRQVARTFDTKREAEEWLAEQRTQLRHGDWIDPAAGAVTLAEYFEAWVVGRPLAPRTTELYRWLWHRCLEDQLGSRPLSTLTPVLIRAWHASLVRAERPGPTTIAKAYRLLSAVLSDAVRDGVIVRSPCTIVGAGVEPRRPIDILTIEQIERLADAMPAHLRAAVLVAGYGGLRWGEVAGLIRTAVDRNAGTVLVHQVLSESLNGQLMIGPPKTAAGYRTVALPASVAVELGAHIDRFTANELVFTTVTGLPLRRPNFTQTWKRACRLAGLEGVRFHDLRHSAATLATRHGATVREVQVRLGHSSPMAALRYQHVVSGADAVIAQRLVVARVSGDIRSAVQVTAPGHGRPARL